MRSEEPVLADGSPEMFVLFDGYLNFTGRDPNLRARGSRVNEVVVRVMEYVYNWKMCVASTVLKYVGERLQEKCQSQS